MKNYIEKHANWFWPLVTFVVSILGTPLFGRAMWCDEIIRIAAAKNYTVAQLIACQHLKDFDSQSPIGYIILRPFQQLLGIEWGGYPFAALSAALIVFVVLQLIARWNDGQKPGICLCAFVALNPLLVWFGGELWFYQMFAAAYAFTFYLLVIWDDPRPFGRQVGLAIALIVSGYLSMALHFCGLFPYGLIVAVFCLHRWFKRGFQDAFLMGILLAIPALLNVPVYLNAQYAAGHIGTKEIHWMRLIDRIPGWLGTHFVDNYPQLTGASWLGALASFGGIICLFRRNRRDALLALAAISGFWFFAAYSLMREFLMPVARYWTYALTPAITIAALGFARLIAFRPRIGKTLLAIAVALNAIGVLNIITMTGRTEPYLKFTSEIARSGKPEALILPNHYVTRMFNLTGYIKQANDSYCVFPSYWEQGDKVRIEGLRQLRRLSPLSPILLGNDEQREWYVEAGYTSTNIVCETRAPFHRLASLLNVFPEPLYANNPTNTLAWPTAGELAQTADRENRAVVVPGANIRLAQMPPRKKDQPLTSFLMLAGGSEGSLRVRLPASSKATTAKLILAVGSDKAHARATVNGKAFSLESTFRPFSIDLANLKPGEWQDVPLSVSGGILAILSAEITASPGK